MEYYEVGDKVLIPVGDDRKMVFTILKFDRYLALMSSDAAGENIKRGEKICYRLNGKERVISEKQIEIDLQ